MRTSPTTVSSFVQSVKVDLFPDEVYVFTSKSSLQTARGGGRSGYELAQSGVSDTVPASQIPVLEQPGLDAVAERLLLVAVSPARRA